jgi:hypothetical protein
MPTPGRIVTFYSYKGGTGRSMALANFAWILAANGKKVLTIDWDLEAPGLHRYFRPFLVDPDLLDTDGLIDTFWTFAASALARAPSQAGPTSTPPSTPEETVFGIEDSKRRLKWKFPSDGYIDFVGAGRQGATYSERVNTFDWKRFYELGGAQMLTTARVRLRTQYDWILIDSRTGVSDTAGICTMQMPDAVVPCFTLNRQSIDGVAAVLRSIRGYRSASVDGSKIDFFPLATRIENAEQVRLEVARRFARGAVAEFLPDAMKSDARRYWDKMELAYRPAYAFEEVLASFGDATDAAGASDTMLSQVEAMSQQITGDKDLQTPEVVESERAAVLAKYALGPLPSKKETAEQNETADSDFLRGLTAKEQEWRTTGFNWRNLLSRRELDLLTDKDRNAFGRNMTYYLVNSERGQRLFRTVDIAFVATWLMAILFWAWDYILISNRSTLTDLGFVLVYLLTFGSLFVPILIGAIVSWIAEKPYGMRPVQIISLVIRGPFKPSVYDYENLEKYSVRNSAR